MSKSEKKFIYILLFIILLFASILVIRILSTPQYDPVIYNEVYEEYAEIQNQTPTTNAETSNSKKIYISQGSTGNSYRVVANIIIPKIRISYPVISETTDEYLKISPTKLWGPEPNQVGNFCIIGHNYKSKKFFSNLKDLQNGDIVQLKDKQGTLIEYQVYDKYEVKETDLSCTNQNTNGKKELTLITCTNYKKKRLVVKCTEIL